MSCQAPRPFAKHSEKGVVVHGRAPPFRFRLKAAFLCGWTFEQFIYSSTTKHNYFPNAQAQLSTPLLTTLTDFGVVVVVVVQQDSLPTCEQNVGCIRGLPPKTQELGQEQKQDQHILKRASLRSNVPRENISSVLCPHTKSYM